MPRGTSDASESPVATAALAVCAAEQSNDATSTDTASLAMGCRPAAPTVMVRIGNYRGSVSVSRNENGDTRSILEVYTCTLDGGVCSTALDRQMYTGGNPTDLPSSATARGSEASLWVASGQWVRRRGDAYVKGRAELDLQLYLFGRTGHPVHDRVLRISGVQ
eukprot:SAG31_NODE_6537_length_1984_cov_2.385676_1_plen_162_part_10